MKTTVVRVTVLIVVLLLSLSPVSSSSLRSAEHDDAAAEQQKHHNDILDSVNDQAEYGVDVSMPIHRRVSDNYAWLPHNVDPEHNQVPTQYEGQPIQPLGDRQAAYAEHLDGCRKHYQNVQNGAMCDIYEYDRILMNNRQPQSMQNYTSTGFKKIRAPPRIVSLAKTFWEKNKNNRKKEVWGPGNTYTNHWKAPTMMVSVDDKGLRGSGVTLKQTLWSALRGTLQEWTDEDLTPSSMYGIRVYQEGAVLLPHVDRLPLVCSAMINVAQDVDEDWPMEIYDHDGRAHNVTLHPGDMLLFESHSILHGRPFPLKGRFYAMLFIHFEPTGHSLHAVDNVDEQYKQAAKDGVGGQSAVRSLLPPYIKRFSPEEEHWRSQHPEGWRTMQTVAAGKAEKAHEAHVAAAKGDVEKLEDEIEKTSKDETKKRAVISERDDNGWQPIHEGAAAGHKDVVELLVSHGADINTRTQGGEGGTPLHIAEQKHGASHPIVQYLKSLGALNVGPEL